MDNRQVAQKIKELCKKKGISISKLTQESKINKGLIYDMEKRDKTPSTETIKKIADYLQCSTDTLLKNEVDPSMFDESTLQLLYDNPEIVKIALTIAKLPDDKVHQIALELHDFLQSQGLPEADH